MQFQTNSTHTVEHLQFYSQKDEWPVNIEDSHTARQEN